MKNDLLNEYRELVKLLMNTHPDIIQDVENNDRFSDELFLDTIRRNPVALSHFSNPTYEMCKEAISIRGELLKYSPFQDEELIMISIKQDGTNLQYVPKEHRYLSVYETS